VGAELSNRCVAYGGSMLGHAGEVWGEPRGLSRFENGADATRKAGLQTSEPREPRRVNVWRVGCTLPPGWLRRPTGNHGDRRRERRRGRLHRRRFAVGRFGQCGPRWGSGWSNERWRFWG